MISAIFILILSRCLTGQVEKRTQCLLANMCLFILVGLRGAILFHNWSVQPPNVGCSSLLVVVVKEMIDAFVERRTLYAKLDGPYHMRDVEQKFDETESILYRDETGEYGIVDILNPFNLTGKYEVSKMNITGLSTANVSNFTFNPESMRANFELVFPQIHVELIYKINGTNQNLTINGKGNIKINFTNFRLFVELEFPKTRSNYMPIVTDIRVYICIDGHSYDIKGIEIHGKPPKRIYQMLGGEYIKEDCKKVIIPGHIRLQKFLYGLNILLLDDGTTIQEITKRMKVENALILARIASKAKMTKL